MRVLGGVLICLGVFLSLCGVFFLSFTIPSKLWNFGKESYGVFLVIILLTIFIAASSLYLLGIIILDRIFGDDLDYINTKKLLTKIVLFLFLPFTIIFSAWFGNRTFKTTEYVPNKKSVVTNSNSRYAKSVPFPPTNTPACTMTINSKIIKIKNPVTDSLDVSLKDGINIRFSIPEGYEKGKHISVEDFMKKVKVGDKFIKKENTYAFVTVSKDTNNWAMSCPLDIYNKLNLQLQKK